MRKIMTKNITMIVSFLTFVVSVFLCLMSVLFFDVKAAETDSIVEETGYSLNMPFYLNDQEARCFIGFLFNTKELTQEQITNGNIYDFLTGKLSGDEEIEAGFVFKDLMDAQLSRIVNDYEYGTEIGRQWMLDYLYLKAEDTSDLAESIVSETLHNITNSGIDYILDEYTIHGGPLQNMEYEYIQDGRLIKGLYDDIKGVPAKVDYYKKAVLALSGSAFYAGGVNRLEMYNYFLFCKDNMIYRHNYSEDIYQLVMSQQGLNEHLAVIKAIQPTLANWEFLDENMLLWGTEERMSLMEKWADFSYCLEDGLSQFPKNEFVDDNEDSDTSDEPDNSTSGDNEEQTIEVTSIKLPLSSYTTFFNVSIQCNAATYPENATVGKEITYSSSNPSIFKVDSQGNITIVSYGVADLIATSSNGISTSAEITVLPFEGNLTDDGLIITEYIGDDTTVTIPSMSNNTKITRIDSEAFYGCTNLTSIAIPSSVTSIGNGAFRYCSSLTSAIIAEGVTSIGDRVFYGCTSLTSITIPSSVTNIGDEAFYNCKKLTSVTIAEGVTNIDSGAFSGCISLESITIPSTITSVDDRTFYGCTSLISATLSEGVTSIDWNAFSGCTSLESITIPSSVTSVDAGAFEDCSNLENVYITDIAAWCTIDYFGPESQPLCCTDSVNLFLNNKLVKELVIPDGVEFISDYAFYGYDYLTSITIPSSVTSIGDSAFAGCTSLASVTIAKGVTSIGSSAFLGCGLTSVTIPSSVISIGSGAFSGCKDLSLLTIHKGVTNIDRSAFSGCTSLALVTIPNSVTSIGEYAFWRCTNLTSITIPSSVTSIGEEAFSECTSLTSVYIPSSVISIGASAFYECTSITSVTIAEGVTSIGARSFYKCTSLESVNIPSSLTNIGNYAFNYCTSITSVTIAEGITTIGDCVFAGCTSLASITIPNSVTSIGEYAFWNCTNLTSITIPSSVTSIGNKAFYGCNYLIDVYYNGSENQWNIIGIGENNDDLLNANIHFVLLTPDKDIYFSGAVLTLQDNICINFKANETLFKEVGYENPYVIVELNGVEYAVSDYSIVDGEYVFDFTDISSANANDIVKATLYATYDGTTYVSEPLEYSLATYCDNNDHTWKSGVCLVCGEVCEHNYIDDVCTVCGRVKDVSAEFEGASVTLGGTIGVNFYYDISDDILTDEDAVVRFIVPDTGSTYTIEIPVGDGEWDESLGLYKFTCTVAAKEMTSVIKAQVITSLAETEIVEYTVYDYAVYMLEHSENYAAEQDLIKALLNYGAASQLYFGYNTDNLANDILDEADKVIGAYSFDDFSPVFIGQDSNVSYYGSSLSLKSETAIKHYFVVKDESSMPEFKVNGEVVESVKNGNFYEVKITEISAHNLDEIHTIEAGAIKMNYGVFSYAYQAMKTDKETLKNTVNALYSYNLAADAYLSTEN